jgi:hypothetical protein
MVCLCGGSLEGYIAEAAIGDKTRELQMKSLTEGGLQEGNKMMEIKFLLVMGNFSIEWLKQKGCY